MGKGAYAWTSPVLESEAHPDALARGDPELLCHAWRDYRVTNGFAEGKNNRIKVIIRSGYGYRNLENLGLRILMTNHPASYAAAPC